MSEISVIAGLSPSAVRLLEAAGVRRIDNLARQDVKALFQRLSAIDSERGWMREELTTETVGRWIQGARTVVTGPLRQGRTLAVNAGEPGDLMLNLDAVPEVLIVDDLEDGRTSPPEGAAGDPATQPPATGRGAAPRELDNPSAAIGSAAPVALRPTVNASHDPSRHQPAAQEWKRIEKERFRDFSTYVENATTPQSGGKDPLGAGTPAPARAPVLTVAPREPVPRRIRRGVPHPRPFVVLFGAIIVLLSRLLFLAVLIGTPLALIPAFAGGDTHHLLGFLWIAGAWMFSCVLYVMVALRVRCRVCTNQIFFSKRCFKNVKAHRVFGLGLVGSLAVHAIVFGWFRCMYCGTAIRLKCFGGPEPARPRRGG